MRATARSPYALSLSLSSSSSLWLSVSAESDVRAGGGVRAGRSARVARLSSLGVHLRVRLRNRFPLSGPRFHSRRIVAIREFGTDSLDSGSPSCRATRALLSPRPPSVRPRPPPSFARGAACSACFMSRGGRVSDGDQRPRPRAPLPPSPG